MDLVDTLLARLTRSKQWPPRFEHAIRADIAKWAAFLTTDERALRTLADWPHGRDYVPDNLPEKIAAAFGGLLYSEDPRFTAGVKADQPRLNDLTDGIASELRAAVETCVGEGEVWWRLAADPAMSANALVTWHSRLDVIALTTGRRCGLVAFVSVLGPRSADEPVGDAENTGKPVWRHLEIHTDGRVTNVLFKGTYSTIGDEAPLADHPDVADIAEVWNHGLPMLAGRVVRKWGKRGRSVSVLSGVWRRLLKLNEAATIGAENMRLTAKKRLVLPLSSAPQHRPTVPGEVVDDDLSNRRGMPAPPKWDAGEDIIFDDPLEIEEGATTARRAQVMEYSFDAQALITYELHLVETTLNRCDIVPQWVGLGDFGMAITGIARKLTLLPTTNAAEGIARVWDETVPMILALAQRLEAMSQTEGGLGIGWKSPGRAPAVERRPPLPEDDSEVATRQATLKNAGLLSVWLSVKERHDDWTDEQILEEVARIRADDRATLPHVTFNNPPPEPGDEAAATDGAASSAG